MRRPGRPARATRRRSPSGGAPGPDGGRHLAPSRSGPGRAGAAHRPRRRPVSGLLAVGVDIGGTKISGGVVDDSGTVIDRVRRPTPGSDVNDTEDVIVQVVADLCSRHPRGCCGHRRGRLDRHRPLDGLVLAASGLAQ